MRHLSVGICLMFSHCWTGVTGFAGKVTAILITAYPGYVLSTRLIAADGDLDPLTQAVFVRCLHCPVPLPHLSILYSLEGSLYAKFTIKGGASK